MALYYSLTIFCDDGRSEQCAEAYEGGASTKPRVAELKAWAKHHGWRQSRHEVLGVRWACPACVHDEDEDRRNQEQQAAKDRARPEEHDRWPDRAGWVGASER